MRIAVVVSGRAHEGGVTTYINNIVRALELNGQDCDVISIFGISGRRKIKERFVTACDRCLANRSWLTFVAYVIAKNILWLQFLRACAIRRYTAILAMDPAATNVVFSFTRLTGTRLVERVGAAMTHDLIQQLKLRQSSRLVDFFESEERHAFRRADAVLPNSVWAASHVKRMSPSANLLPSLISPVDCDLFTRDTILRKAMRSQLELGEEQIVVLFPSRLERRKGTLVAAEAMRDVLRIHKDWCLIYAGEGPGRRELEEFLQENGIGDKIRLLGRVPHEKMNALYNASDIVLVCPVAGDDWEEPLPNCVLEAMACSKPVLVSAVGGLRDIIVSDKTGIVVPSERPDLIAKEMSRLGEEAALREQIAQAGFELVRVNCSFSSVGRRIADILHDEENVEIDGPYRF